jgi:hypothetical protein
VPYLGSAEDFKKFVWDVATRNHCFEYEKIVIISDGATWIRTMCNELFPGSQQILDYYHLAENIYSFGKHIFSNDEKKYTHLGGIAAASFEKRTHGGSAGKSQGV